MWYFLFPVVVQTCQLQASGIYYRHRGCIHWWNVVRKKGKRSRWVSWLCVKTLNVSVAMIYSNNTLYHIRLVGFYLVCLSCVCVYVDQNKGTLPPSPGQDFMGPYRNTTPLLYDSKFAHDQKNPPPWLNCHGCIW